MPSKLLESLQIFLLFHLDQENGVVQENVKSQQHQTSPQPRPSMPRRSSHFIKYLIKIAYTSVIYHDKGIFMSYHNKYPKAF